MDNTTTERFVADVTAFVRDVDRAARADDQFGEASAKAALAARRMGLAAAEAGDKAARGQKQAAEAAELAAKAQQNAADAAEKLARGEATADEAARAEARALKDVERAADAAARASRDIERADIKQAAAAIAAAKANDEHAKQLRQLGKDAETTSSITSRAAKMGADGLQSVSDGIAEVTAGAPIMATAILAAIPLIPVAAEAAAGAITFGLGGALAGLGIMAVAKSREVQNAFGDLKTHILKDLDEWAAPFKGTLEEVFKVARTTFDGFGQVLKQNFASGAEALKGFVDALGPALLQLRPAISEVTIAFESILHRIEPMLPQIMHNLGDSIQTFAQVAADHAQDIAEMASGVAVLVKGLAELVSVLAKAEPIFEMASLGMQGLHTATLLWGGSMGSVTQSVGAGAAAVAAYALQMNGVQAPSAGANQMTRSLTGSAGELTNAMSLAGESVKDLKDDLDALTAGTLTEREAMARAAQDAIDMAKAIKENGAAHGLQTEKGIKNEEMLTRYAADLDKATIALKENGGSTQDVARFMEQARTKIYNAAVQMGYTKKEAEALATKLTGVKDAANSIPKSRNIKVTMDASQAYSVAANLQRYIQSVFAGHAGGGLITTYQHGGPVVAHYASGGATQYHPQGEIHGPGTTTSDSITARVSKGEYIVNAASYAANAGLVNAINAAHGRPVSQTGSGSKEQTNPAYRNASAVTLPKYAPPMGAAHRSYAETLNGGSGGASRPIVQNSNVYVAGSVWSEQELASVVQRVMLNNGWATSLPAGR